MEENQPQDLEEQVPQPSTPVDGTVDVQNPHPVDENPEDHIGDELKDPWDDETQTDWPSNTNTVDVASNESGSETANDNTEGDV